MAHVSTTAGQGGLDLTSAIPHMTGGWQYQVYVLDLGLITPPPHPKPPIPPRLLPLV